MNVEYYWADGVRGKAAAQDRGLDTPTPLMRLDPDDGGDQFLFSSGGKFYLWNIVSGDLSAIVSPTSQNDIIKALGDMLTDAGSKDLKTEFVPLKG
ncbi:hypothetical protein PG985_001487 [Apiospora marii]|uniref:Uncharacterized protein n=1 Tax=Apiospora marii TaxID=335849 RepID=A0ABR1RIC0_9PEZI